MSFQNIIKAESILSLLKVKIKLKDFFPVEEGMAKIFIYKALFISGLFIFQLAYIVIIC